MTIGHPLLRRIVREHRRLVVPLGVLLVANIIAYAVLVYPLQQRVANIEDREQSAARELTSAQQEHRQAAGTLSGKDRAAMELQRFYNEVLPRDLSSARELTFVRLPQLANQFDVVFDRRTTVQPAQRRDSNLVQLQTRVELAGRYSDLRSFIHQLESWREFVVIDNITLSEEDEETGLLELELELSNYYKAPAP
jgi:Tfp pilus assembly protein PilO